MRKLIPTALNVINVSLLISFLHVLPAAATEPHRVAFIDAYVIRGVLDTMGYEEGENIVFKRFQSAPLIGRHLPEVVAEALDWNPDVIVTKYANATRAAMKATADVPIVAYTIVDPVKAGLVESFAKPGGNVTGVLLPDTVLFGKKLELLQEILPNLKRVGVIFDPGTEHGVTTWQHGQSIALRHELHLEPLRLDLESDVIPALQAAIEAKCEAFIMLSGRASWQHKQEVSEFSIAHGYPVVGPDAWYVTHVSTGLVSLGPQWLEVDLEVADLIDRILNGSDPGSLPMRRISNSELIVDRGVADKMGLVIPNSVLARAYRVIN